MTPVVKRRKKKSARSEESERSGNMNVTDKRISLVRYRKVDRILGIYTGDNLKASGWGGSETQPYCPIASRTRT